MNMLTLTTDRHEASRGLSATAGLLVLHSAWEINLSRHRSIIDDARALQSTHSRITECATRSSDKLSSERQVEILFSAIVLLIYVSPGKKVSVLLSS